MKNRGILSGIISIAAGAAGIYFLNKYKIINLPIEDLKLDTKEKFESEKDRVMNMIEESREKFEEHHTPPVKHQDKKSFIHNQNHNVKPNTKVEYSPKFNYNKVG